MLILMLLSLMRYLLFHFFWPPSFPCPLHTLFPSESMPLVDISASAIWRPDWFDWSIQCGDNSFFIKPIISFALRISCKLHDFKKRTKAMIIYKRYVFQLILSSFTSAFIFASVKKWGLGMWLNFSAGLKKIPVHSPTFCTRTFSYDVLLSLLFLFFRSAFVSDVGSVSRSLDTTSFHA